MFVRVCGTALALVCGLAAADLAYAQDSTAGSADEAATAQATGVDTVFATVNGKDITTDDIAIAAESLSGQLQRIPEQLRLTVLIDILVNQQLFANAARDAGIEDRDEYKNRMDYFTGNALRDTYVEVVLADQITEEAVKARYESEVAEMPKEEEVSARHILVETEEEAKSLAEEARGDADFAELAKENSTGPSAGNGGDLGYFTKDRMVPAFSEVAFSLAVGEVSDPVQTEFGWHVIKLEDRRQTPPPAFDDVRDQMEALVLRDIIKEKTAELREAADVSYPGAPQAAPAVEAPQVEAPAAARPDEEEQPAESENAQ